MGKLAIDLFKNDIRFRDFIEHIETIPVKKAGYKYIDGLDKDIINYLDSKGLKLYEHQADSYNAIKNNENIIITTPTASGKTLAFNLPVMETLKNNPEATALYIYPAKALSNDQLQVLKDFEEDLKIKTNPKTYDGDTDKALRYKIRQNSRIILTNPYQLHHILAWYHQWKRFYKNLKYIIIDEAHYYKGVFGSNVAFLIRRLKRIVNFYGANPQFILSSATLANPLELASKLTGEEFILIDKDSSPSGEKDFILYNPYKNQRRKHNLKDNTPSVHQETERIFLYLIVKNIQTLCFTISRKMTELIARWAKRDMNELKPKFVDKIAAYRAGYLASERREIEKGLKNRKYLGVTCTNALELGIDIGSLDAVIISGYPGTMISTWQQSGRSGRGNQKSLTILIAFENQLDQYFMKNPDFFFDKAHENAIVDLNNESLQNAHLICAAKELFLTKDDVEKYFACDGDKLDVLVENNDLYKNPKGKYIYPYDDSPSFQHNLDQISSDIYHVMCNGNLLEKMEKSHVYKEAHEGAVLINKGETYIVDSVDLNRGFVNVIKQEVDYHTIVLKDILISISRKISKRSYGDLTINFGELQVTEDYFKYKKMHYSKQIGVYSLDLPPLKFKTKGLWFTIPEEVKEYLEDKYSQDDVFTGGLHGAEHALISLFSVHTMCDRFDIGGLSTNYHVDTQEASIFIYDAYEGGIGITEKATEVFIDLLKSTIDLLDNCDCKYGCPSCIYSPKCGKDNKPLHKEATSYILRYMYEQINSPVKNVEIEELRKIEETKEISHEEELFNEAIELFINKQYFLSKDVLLDLLSINSKNADAWALIGKILYEQEDINGAITFTRRALSLDPSHFEASSLMIKIGK